MDNQITHYQFSRILTFSTQRFFLRWGGLILSLLLCAQLPAYGDNEPKWNLKPEKFTVPTGKLRGNLAGEPFSVGKATWDPRLLMLTIESKRMPPTFNASRVLTISLNQFTPIRFPVKISYSTAQRSPTIMLDLYRSLKGPVLFQSYSYEYSLFLDVLKKDPSGYTVTMLSRCRIIRNRFLQAPSRLRRQQNTKSNKTVLDKRLPLPSRNDHRESNS